MKQKHLFLILLLSAAVLIAAAVLYVNQKDITKGSDAGSNSGTGAPEGSGTGSEPAAKDDILEESSEEENSVEESLAEESLNKEGLNKEGLNKESLAEESLNKEGLDEKTSAEGMTEEGLSDEESTDEKTREEPTAAFYYTALDDSIKQRITGKSYPDTQEPLQISYEELAYVHILHYDFNGQVQEGELICNQAIAQDLVEIFTGLYDNQYPIEKIRLIDEYNADDEASMADNNTSCFNYRTVPGKTKLSNHSYGRAIDINPLYNPYVRTKNGETLISPDNGAAYADRGAEFPYKINKDDLCYKLFIEHGFSWGGVWNSSKDYQHFEKTK